MLFESYKDLPDEVRQRADVQAIHRSWRPKIVEHTNRLHEEGVGRSEAIDQAIQAVGKQADKATEWVKVHTTGPIEQDGQVVGVTQGYFERTVAEFDRYQSDLQEAGLEWYPAVTRPVFGPHVDSGRRDGDVVALKTAPDELWAKIVWNPHTWTERKRGHLRQLSVNIVPEHSDPQLMTTYGPHLREVSPTNFGKDKYAGIEAAVTKLTAAECADIGLEVEGADQPEEGAADDDSDDKQTDDEPDDTTLTAAQEDTVELSKWLKTKLKALDNLPEGASLPSKADVVEQLADQAGVDVAQVEALASGKIAYPTDAMVEALGEMFGVGVDKIRAGNLSTGEPDESGESDDTPEGGEGMEGAGDGEGMGEDKAPGIAASESGPDHSDQIMAKLDELEQRVARQERAAQKNTAQQSNPGEQPLVAAEDDPEDDGPDWSDMSDKEALDRVKDETDLVGHEAASEARRRQGKA